MNWQLLERSQGPLLAWAQQALGLPARRVPPEGKVGPLLRWALFCTGGGSFHLSPSGKPVTAVTGFSLNKELLIFSEAFVPLGKEGRREGRREGRKEGGRQGGERASQRAPAPVRGCSLLLGPLLLSSLSESWLVSKELSLACCKPFWFLNNFPLYYENVSFREVNATGYSNPPESKPNHLCKRDKRRLPYTTGAPGACFCLLGCSGGHHLLPLGARRSLAWPLGPLCGHVYNGLKRTPKPEEIFTPQPPTDFVHEDFCP